MTNTEQDFRLPDWFTSKTSFVDMGGNRPSHGVGVVMLEDDNNMVVELCSTIIKAEGPYPYVQAVQNATAMAKGYGATYMGLLQVGDPAVHIYGGPDRTLSPSQWAAIHADFKLAKDDGTTWVLCNHGGSTVLEKVQIVGPR